MYKLIPPCAFIGLLMTLCPFFTQAAQTCKPESIQASTPTAQFSDHNDGTVTDTQTGLMWKRCSEGQAWDAVNATCANEAGSYTWQAALRLAATVNSTGFAGHTDWRVPNVKELRSITERQCFAPGINATVFPATPTAFYWSSSPSTSNPSFAWTIGFGQSNYSNRISVTTQFSVRLVRDTP